MLARVDYAQFVRSSATFAGGLLALVALIATGCLDRSHRTDGPLNDRTGNEYRVSGPVKRGQFFVLGLFVPKNESGQEVVLERLEPADPGLANALEMRYSAVLLQARGCRVGAARDWPPLGCRGKLRPVDGFRIPDGTETQILVGARSQQLGTWSIPAFRLRYRAGDRGYETTYREGMKLQVVRGLGFARRSASFASFETAAHNIGCAYTSATGVLRCELRSGPCYEMTIAGPPRDCAGGEPHNASDRVLKARGSWLYHGFRCYAGHANVRCRNQVFEGFFLSDRRSHRT
jgi:hypothetical protein